MTNFNSETAPSVGFVNSNIPDLEDLFSGLTPGVKASTEEGAIR